MEADKIIKLSDSIKSDYKKFVITYKKYPYWLGRLLCLFGIHNWLLIEFDFKNHRSKYKCVYCNKIKYNII